MIARTLAGLGYEVHRNIGKTGVVGRLAVGDSTRSIGLRADIDALPIEEIKRFSHRSTIKHRMHACGHDGHVASLLGAARYLSEARRFNGIVNLIFQPAEEGVGGARAMLADGLFDRFPCEKRLGEIYAEIMQANVGRISVAVRELADGGIWRCTEGEPYQAALLMCDIRRGCPAEQRARLAQALIDACVEVLGLQVEQINVEFTQHAGDEMFHPLLGGLSDDLTTSAA